MLFVCIKLVHILYIASYKLFGINLEGRKKEESLFIFCPILLHCDLIIIIMVIFKCYFSGEHIALSINKNNNGVNIALGKTNRLKTLCMMQINT